MSIDWRDGVLAIEVGIGGEEWSCANLCQLSLGLPRAGKGVRVSAVQLTGDVSRDADAGCAGAGV